MLVTDSHDSIGPRGEMEKISTLIWGRGALQKSQARTSLLGI